MDEQPTQPEDIGYHLESLVETSDIGFDYLKLLSVKMDNRCHIHHDELAGMIIIYFVNSVDDAVVHYISDLVGLIYNPENMQLIGIQFEGI